MNTDSRHQIRKEPGEQNGPSQALFYRLGRGRYLSVHASTVLVELTHRRREGSKADEPSSGSRGPSMTRHNEWPDNISEGRIWVRAPMIRCANAAAAQRAAAKIVSITSLCVRDDRGEILRAAPATFRLAVIDARGRQQLLLNRLGERTPLIHQGAAKHSYETILLLLTVCHVGTPCTELSARLGRRRTNADCASFTTPGGRHGRENTNPVAVWQRFERPFPPVHACVVGVGRGYA